MPTYRNEWNVTVDDADRQIGFDLPNSDGVSGDCLVTLDARVWREELNRPAGVRVEVTVTALGDDEVDPDPLIDSPSATLTDEQRAAAIKPEPPA